MSSSRKEAPENVSCAQSTPISPLTWHSPPPPHIHEIDPLFRGQGDHSLIPHWQDWPTWPRLFLSETRVQTTNCPSLSPGTLFSLRNPELLKQKESLENNYMNSKPTTYFSLVNYDHPFNGRLFPDILLSHFEALLIHPQILRLSFKRMSFSKA